MKVNNHHCTQKKRQKFAKETRKVRLNPKYIYIKFIKSQHETGAFKKPQSGVQGTSLAAMGDGAEKESPS